MSLPPPPGMLSSAPWQPRARALLPLVALSATLCGASLPRSADAGPPEPIAAPLAVELALPASFPFAALARLSRLADVTLVLDTTRAPLRRGRVDLLRGLRGVFGARVSQAPSAADTKLLRRLQPVLLVVDAGKGETLEAHVDAAESVGADAYRVEFAAPPSTAALKLLQRLRPCTLRLSVGPQTPADTFAQLATFSGRLELAVPEDAPEEWLKKVAWPPQAALLVAPRDGNYLADANLTALAAAGRVRHVARVTLPLRRVEAEQLRRLAGLSLEVALDTPPSPEALRTLMFTQGRLPWPIPADGGIPAQQIFPLKPAMPPKSQ